MLSAFERLYVLDEAKMSDEDREDSQKLLDIGRKVKTKADLKKLTDEERALLDKYGLETFGWRGENRTLTKGGVDIFDGAQNTYRDSRYNHSRGKEEDSRKVNWADKARKVDARAENLPYNSEETGWIRHTRGYNQRNTEREKAAEREQKDYVDFKIAKERQASYENEDSSKYLGSRRIERSKKKNAEFQKKQDERISDAENKIDNALKRRKEIMDKHKRTVESIRNVLKSMALNEAKMSDEDRKDSKALQDLFYNAERSWNYRPTEEEQELMKKYGIEQNDRGAVRVPSAEGIDDWGVYNNKEMNVADYVRKLPERQKKWEDNTGEIYDRRSDHRRWSKRTDPFQSRRKNNDAKVMGSDVAEFKKAYDTIKKSKADIGDAKEGKRMSNARQNSEINGIKRSSLERKKANQRKADRAKADANRIRSKYGLKTESLLTESDWKDYFNKKDSKYDSNGDWNDSFDRDNMSTEVSERIIPTGVTGRKGYEVLSAVIGQMSDGKWENDPNMEKFWQFVSIDNDNNIVIRLDDIRSRRSNSKWSYTYTTSGFDKKSDDWVRNFFANKIKNLAETEMFDNNKDPYKGWNPDNDMELVYLSYDEDITVADAYAIFKQLKSYKG